MKTVLLVNECESDNLGDLAIASSLDRKISSEGFKTKKVAFSSIKKPKGKSSNSVEKVKYFSFLKKIKIFVALKWLILNYSRVQRSFVGVDKVILGGGQLVLSNPQFPIAILLWVTSSRIRKVPIYIIGVGCGSSFSFIEKKIIKYSLNRVNKIYLRDLDSISNLESNFSIKAELSFDCAYRVELKEGDNMPFAVTSIISYEVFERYRKESSLDIKNKEDFYLNWLYRINNLNVDEVFFISTTSLDCVETDEFIRKFEKQIKHKYRVFSQLTTLDEYESILKRADVVLSARMHSLILGENYGCKIEPWLVSEKLDTYAKSFSNFSTEEKSEDLKKALQDILK